MAYTCKPKLQSLSRFNLVSMDEMLPLDTGVSQSVVCWLKYFKMRIRALCDLVVERKLYAARSFAHSDALKLSRWCKLPRALISGPNPKQPPFSSRGYLRRSAEDGLIRKFAGELIQ